MEIHYKDVSYKFVLRLGQSEHTVRRPKMVTRLTKYPKIVEALVLTFRNAMPQKTEQNAKA